MGNFFQRYPLATVMGWGATVLTVLVALQGAGILDGRPAATINTVAAVLQIILTALARQQVTPVVNPKDNQGRRLVPTAVR